MSSIHPPVCLPRSLPLLVAKCLLAVAGLTASLHAEDPVDWLTGTPLRRRLEEPVSVSWSGTSLRQSLGNLSEARQVAICLDRRIDPGQPLNIRLDEVPLRQGLEQIAGSIGAGVCLLESVIYLGPPETAARLRTVAAMRKAELGQLPPGRRLQLVRLQRWQWEDLSTPRELLGQVAEEGRFQIRGLQTIPHDLWPAADLPGLATADRLTLVCGQFDLTFAWDPQEPAIELMPIPDVVGIRREYSGGRKPAEFAAQLAKLLPDSKVTVEAGKVAVLGRLEDHERIEAAQRGERPAEATQTTTTREVTVDNFSVTNVPLSNILDVFRKRLGLEIKIDAAQLKAAGMTLNMQVSVTVKDVTIDQLLEATLKPVGLKFQRKDKVVTIFPESR